jgi:D-alanyl-D-alanine carboxypeptidase/D-alanyl-D-alanine-endopeptidase (penicillin-binding protein 4)
MRALRRGTIAVVLVVGAGPAAYGTTQFVRHHLHDRATVAGEGVPRALAAATAAPARPAARTAPLPTAAGVQRQLRTPLADENLGSRIHVEVRDASTGRVLFQRDPSTPAVPASTAKLFTAAAALAQLPAGQRITTRVVKGPIAGSIVLVGGGDPTLTAATGNQAPDYAGAAKISDLAAQLAKRNIPVNRIVVDDSLYQGPDVSPGWDKEDVPSDYASAITAVMADGGRAAPGDVVRSDIPDLAAANSLAAALDIPNAEVVRGRAPNHAAVLASVRSAPIGTLVGEMLQTSDNVIAEALARQVAIAVGQPASFLGSARAVRQVMARLGVDVGTGLTDGSGLSPRDHVSAHALGQVLTLAASSPQLAPLLADLPVGAWSGTLVDRYRGPVGRYAAGLVRAKTGTLSDVSTLAGVVHDHDGRLLVFVLMADKVPGGLTPYAEAAWDVAVTRLAQCGCR